MYLLNFRYQYIEIFCFLILSIYFDHSLAHSRLVYKRHCNESNADLKNGPICALDTISVCFRKYATEAEMEAEVCANNITYLLYNIEYCNIVGFMCSKDYQEAFKKYMEQENLDHTIYSIYKQPSSKQSWL